MPYGIQTPPDYRKRRMLGENPLEKFKDVYENEGPALSDYKRTLGEAPQREDYGNSTGRKLLAGVVGGLQALREGAGAGIKTTTGILDDRFNDANVDYGRKLGGLKEQADLEQAQTNSKLKYLIDSENLIRKDRKLDIDDRVADATVDYRGKAGEAAVINAGANRQRGVDYGRKVDSDIKLDPIRANAAATNAGAAARNAGSNERNAETNAQREARLKSQPPKVKGPTAFEFKDAGNQAMLDAIQEHPEFQEFVGEKGVITPPEDPAKMDSFNLFRQLLEKKKRQRLGKGGDIQLDVVDPDDDEDDYEILED